MPHSIPALYRTCLGSQVVGDPLEVLAQLHNNSADLLLARIPTNKPLEDFGPEFLRALKSTGSLILNLGARDFHYTFAAARCLCATLGFCFIEDYYWHPPKGERPTGPWSRRGASLDIYWWLGKSPVPKSDRRRTICHSGDTCCPSLAACHFHAANGHDCAPAISHVQYFVCLLTEPRDLVVDLYSGSNVSGWVAEGLGRRWLSVEPDRQLAAASLSRFLCGLSPASKRARVNQLINPDHQEPLRPRDYVAAC